MEFVVAGKRKSEVPRQFEGNLDFLELADLIYVLLDLVWGEDWGTFIMHNPKIGKPKNIKFPIITFDLKSQKPGEINNKGTINRVPRLRREYEVTEDSTGEIKRAKDEGLIIDAEVEFVVYGETNLESMKYSEAFMDFINRYKGTLQKYGLQNIWLQEETSDYEHPEDSIHVRRIIYDVRFERVYKSIIGEIVDITIEADTLFDKLAKKGILPSQEGILPLENRKNKEDYK